MNLIRWSFYNIHVPMLEDADGNLWCTSRHLSQALGTTEGALRKLYHQRPEEFGDSLSVTESNANEILRQNRVEFGIQRVRGDMRLWSEDDMLSFAILSRSEVSRQFRRELKEFIKRNARRGYVTREEHDALAGRLEALEALVAEARPSLVEAASAAGSALAAQRGLKVLRDE